MSIIAVVDYGVGNLHSVCKALAKSGVEAIVTDSPQIIAEADGVILPGVGAFDYAVQQLRSHHLEATIHQAVQSGKPFLGICVGLQILFDGSEEGTEPGLGIIPGMVRRFRPEPGLTIPHMGWNTLEITQPQIPVWQHLDFQPWLYFVHSYYVDPVDSQVIAATVTHGMQTVTAAIAQNNLMAVQFHPEKSSDQGLQLLANFVNLVNQSSIKETAFTKS